MILKRNLWALITIFSFVFEPLHFPSAGGAGPEARLEGLLGVPEGDHAALLPVRLAGGPLRRGHPKAPHHRRRRNHAGEYSVSSLQGSLVGIIGS